MLLFDLRIGFGRKRPSIVAVYRSSKKVLERFVGFFPAEAQASEFDGFGHLYDLFL